MVFHPFKKFARGVFAKGNHYDYRIYQKTRAELPEEAHVSSTTASQILHVMHSGQDSLQFVCACLWVMPAEGEGLCLLNGVFVV